MAKTKKAKSASGAVEKVVKVATEASSKPAPKKRRPAKKKMPAKNITLDLGSKKSSSPIYVIPHHHARVMSLFFIFAIGLLAGLLCFNLIVNFGAEVDMDGSFVNYSSVLKSAKSTETWEDFDMKFTYPAKWHQTIVVNDDDSVQTMYITEEIAQFNIKNEIQNPLITIERTTKKAEDVITSLTTSDTSVDEKTLGGMKVKGLIQKGGTTTFVADMKDHTIVITFAEYKTDSAAAANIMLQARNDFADSITFVK